MAHLTQYQTLNAEPLDDDDTMFTEDDRIDVKVVDGSDRWVYWKGCTSLSSVENGKKKKEDQLEGKAYLQAGISLYFVGGLVREE